MKGCDLLLKILRYIFSVLTLSLAIYGLISKNFNLSPIMLLFLGLMMLVMSIEEFQKNQKIYGILFSIVFIFALFVAVQGFIFD